MTNKQSGNTFEKDLCEQLSKEGFWVCNLVHNQSGNPSGIIAVKEVWPYFIHTMVCSQGKFRLSEIKEDQRTTMDLWSECENGTAWFAFLIDEEIIMMAYSDIKKIQLADRNNQILTLSDFVDKGYAFSTWIKR